MVHVVKDVCVVNIAVVVISMIAFRDWLSKLRMNIAKQFSGILSVLIEHKDEEIQIH